MGLKDSFSKRQDQQQQPKALPGSPNIFNLEGYPSESDISAVAREASASPRQLQVLVWIDEQGTGEYQLNCKNALSHDPNENQWLLKHARESGSENLFEFSTSDVALIVSMVEAVGVKAAPKAVIPDSLKPAQVQVQEVYPETPKYRPTGPYADPPGPNERTGEHRSQPASSGTLLDRYEVLGEIGRGAMGVVYKARQLATDRFVAIKALHANLMEDPTHKARFKREVLSTCKMSHPNCVIVYDCDETKSGQPFLIMEFLEGISLKDVFEEVIRLPVANFFDVFIPCMEGLAHAHAKGIIHRDLKPSNIMIVRDEFGKEAVKLVDFGVAKMSSMNDMNQTLTRAGEAVGSPRYMSPEQCLGEETDWRADVYSMGCVMFEGLCGAPPFVAENAYKCMHMHIHAPVPRFEEIDPSLASLPTDLEELIHIMLAKDPEDRPDSTTEIVQVLKMIQRTWRQSQHE